MKANIFRALIAAMVVGTLGLAACGEDSITRDSACEATAQADCNNRKNCGLFAGDPAICITNAKSTCCANGCSGDDARGRSGVEDCVAAIEARTCADASSGALPPICVQ